MTPSGLIDIGVNFHSSQLRGLTVELLERARAAGVRAVLATGTSVSSSESALALAVEHFDIWATAGVHPHTAKDFDLQTEDALAGLWTHPRVVAVGECGLDYNRMFSPREAQRHAFERQIVGALQVGKPLFMHCRDAHEDFLAMTREASAAGLRGVVHCFTGTPDEALQCLALGFDIGVTGWVTDQARGASLREALSVIPLDRLHLETDAPYLRPRNAKKTRPYNEPALLTYVAQAVAAVLDIDECELRLRTQKNSRRLFGIGGICNHPLSGEIPRTDEFHSD